MILPLYVVEYGTAAIAGGFRREIFRTRPTFPLVTSARFLSHKMAHAASAAARSHGSAIGGRQSSGSGALNVADRALASGAAIDNYDDLRRRLLTNPHYRQAPGALAQAHFFDDMSLPPSPWMPPSSWGMLTPWLSCPAALAPAADSLFELALTTSDMMKRIDFIPRMDVLYDDGHKEMVVLADLPGFDKNSVSVYEDDGALVIKGESSKEEECEQKGPHNSKCLMKERRSGYFVRRFQLPKNAVSDGVSATMDKGVLRVNIKLQDNNAAKKPIHIK